MSKTTTTPYIQNVNNLQGQLLNSTGAATTVTVFTAGMNDAVLKSFGITSTDSTERIVQVFINVGGSGTDLLVGSISVPALAGSNGTTPAVDVLRSAMMPWCSYDAYGNKVVNLKAGTLVKIASTTVVATGTAVNAFGEGGDL